MLTWADIKIVVIEDREATAGIIRQGFAKFGITVSTFDSVRAALDSEELPHCQGIIISNNLFSSGFMALEPVQQSQYYNLGIVFCSRANFNLAPGSAKFEEKSAGEAKYLEVAAAPVKTVIERIAERHELGLPQHSAER